MEHDIYAGWLPSQWYYAVHLFLWMGPIAVLHWLVAGRILRQHLRTVITVPLVVGTYLILTDVVAVAAGVWYFDKDLILGFSPGGVPIEEWCFFYLTALLVVQSFIILLPRRYRLDDNADPAS